MPPAAPTRPLALQPLSGSQPQLQQPPERCVHRDVRGRRWRLRAGPDRADASNANGADFADEPTFDEAGSAAEFWKGAHVRMPSVTSSEAVSLDYYDELNPLGNDEVDDGESSVPDWHSTRDYDSWQRDQRHSARYRNDACAQCGGLRSGELPRPTEARRPTREASPQQAQGQSTTPLPPSGLGRPLSIIPPTPSHLRGKANRYSPISVLNIETSHRQLWPRHAEDNRDIFGAYPHGFAPCGLCHHPSTFTQSGHVRQHPIPPASPEVTPRQDGTVDTNSAEDAKDTEGRQRSRSREALPRTSAAPAEATSHRHRAKAREGRRLADLPEARSKSGVTRATTRSQVTTSVIINVGPPPQQERQRLPKKAAKKKAPLQVRRSQWQVVTQAFRRQRPQRHPQEATTTPLTPKPPNPEQR